MTDADRLRREIKAQQRAYGEHIQEAARCRRRVARLEAQLKEAEAKDA